MPHEMRVRLLWRFFRHIVTAGEGATAGVDQNAFGNPACFKIALASGFPSILAGTVNVRSVIGLYQISWLPLPCLSKRQPDARRMSASGR